MFRGLNWNYSTVVATVRDEDGFPTVQYDSDGRNASAYFGLQHNFGFYSRPQDPKVDNEGVPIQGEACTLFYATDGDFKFGWLGIDPRYLQQIPLIAPGGSAQYAVVIDDDGSVRAPFAQFDGDDGTWTVYIPLKGDKAHIIMAGYDAAGDETLVIAHSSGAAITMLDGTCTMKNAAGDAFVSCGPDGVTLGGNTTIAGGFACGGATAQSLCTQPGLAQILAPLIAWLAPTSPGATPANPATASAVATALIALLASPTNFTITTKGI